jgi:hypothetical protein
MIRRLPVLGILLVIAQLSLAHAGQKGAGPSRSAGRWGRIAVAGIAVCLSGCALHHETRTVVIREQPPAVVGTRQVVVEPANRGEIVLPQPSPTVDTRRADEQRRGDIRANARVDERVRGEVRRTPVIPQPSPVIRREHRTEYVDHVLGWATGQRILPDQGGRATYRDYKLASTAFRGQLEARRKVLRDKGYFHRSAEEEVELNITLVNEFNRLDRADAEMRDRYGSPDEP